MTKHRLMAACALGVLSMATGAFAQATSAPAAAAPAPAKPPPAAAAETTIGEIVVTAEKREANLQDVPEAVSAFTAHDRDIKGIETVQDLTDFTPGFTYSSQLDRPAMRGLSRATNIYAQDSSVAVYYDDFFSNSTFLVGRDDMLIDQVEILLGPQGTLYGRNSIGGLINTISKRPTDELSGEARAIVGNYGYTKFEYTIAGPILPHLDFRLSMYDENQRDGWLQNVSPGMPSEGGVKHDPYADIQLEYKTDKDDIWFDSYVVGFNHDRGGPGSLLGTPTAGSYSTNLTGTNQIFFNPNFPYGGGAVPGSVVGQVGTDNPIVNTGNVRDFAHAIATDITVNKAYTFVLHWTHHFDDFDVKYVGGYSQYHYELKDPYFANDNSPISSYKIPTSAALCVPTAESVGYPASAAASSPFCSPLTVNPNQTFQFTTQTDWSSHEITVSSTWNKPIQYIAGIYYYWETDNNPVTAQAIQQPQLASPIALLPLEAGEGFVPAAANPGLYNFFLDYQDRIQSAAAYAQVDWKIINHVKLTAGFRYTFDWKHGTEETRYVDFSSGVLSPYQFGAALPAVDITPLLIDLPGPLNPTAPGSGPGICSLPTLATSGPFAGDYTRCLSDHSQAPTGTAGIEWTPNDNTLIYARYNRGYKAFAFYAGYIEENTEAKPEHVDDFEVGYKATFGHNLTIDADAFYYNYYDDQVPLGFIVGTGSTSTVVTEFVNIPKAVSDGVEVTAYWRPIRHLDLSLTYGLDHTAIKSTCTLVSGVATGACYEDATDPAGTAAGARVVSRTGTTVYTNQAGVPAGTALQAVNGDELPQAPENKIAFNAVYSWEFNPGTLSLSGTYIWKDKSYSSIFTRVYDEAPSWSQVNTRLTWSANHDRYEVVLFCNNVFNTLGYDAAATGYIINNPVSNPGLSYSQVSAFDLTPPRTFGAEFHYKF
jgi:iron complex outermembrane receptor protein